MIVKPQHLLQQYLRPNVSTHKVGVVVSAGKMSKAVKVRIAGQEWNKHIRKSFPSPKTYLVADPNSSLREGDVVRIASGHRSSKHIRHVVTSIVAPFGPPVNERPPVMTAAQLMQRRLELRLEKDVRSKQNNRLTSIWRLQEAKKAGYEIPDLETAMRNVRLEEQKKLEKEREGKNVSHQGQGGQVLTSKDRRRAEREKTKADMKAEDRAKRMKDQVEKEKSEQVVKKGRDAAAQKKAKVTA